MRKIIFVFIFCFFVCIAYSQVFFETSYYSADTLHGAVERNNIDEVERLIKEGENVNKIVSLRFFKTAETPLHIAATKGCSDIAALLIEKKANINILNNEKRTPLHTASFWGQTDVVQVLIDNKASLNLKDSKGDTPLHLAVINGANGHITTEMLITAGADTEIKNDEGQTPLHVAILSGSLESVEVLVMNGADINAVDKKNRTPLHYASRNSDDFNYALDKKYYRKDLISDVMSRFNETRWRSTNDAVWSGSDSDKIVKLLLQNNADSNIRDIEGASPIHYAAFFCNAYALKVLLDDQINKKIDINAIDDSGYTPIHWAALSANKFFVQSLIEKGASVESINIKNGKTPLHMSASNGRYETSEYLIENGADVNAHDKNKLTPLDYAKKHGKNNELIELIMNAKSQ